MHNKVILILALFLSLTETGWAQKWKKWEVQGDTLLNHDEYAKAIKYYTRAVDASKLKDKAAYGTLYKRAVCYYSLEDFQNALTDINQFLTNYTDVFQAHLLRAFIYRELGDSEHQLKDVDAAVDLQPLNYELIKWRSTLYLDNKEYEKARRDLEIVKAVQDDAETETYLGYAYYGLDQLDSALVFMNRAIEMDATYLPAYLYSSSFCLEKAQYELALKYINLALRLDPDNTSALFYKGVALIELKKVDEGCSCLNKAFYAGEDGAGDYLKEYCYSTSK